MRQYLLERRKATGRTTRMIEHVRVKALEGRAVYIMAASNGHAEDLRRAHRDLLDLGVKIETESELFGPGGYDWSRMEPRHRMHSNCVLLIDHAVMESKFGKMLLELGRWDLK